MEQTNKSVLVICVILICVCAFLAPLVHRYMHVVNSTEHYIDDVQDNNVIEEETASLPDPKVMKSARQTILELIVRNLYFLCTHPNTPATEKNDIDNLYKSVSNNFKMLMSSFDVLCQNVNVNNDEIKQRLQDSCDKYYLDLFAQREQALYPGFDTAFSEILNASTYPDNSVFLLDNNQYQFTKNYYSPRFVKYTYDTNHGLIRVSFYNDHGKTIPTYFVLANPFALEFEQLGIFNVISDIDPKFNIMNYYNSDDDNSERAMYLAPTTGNDEHNNKLNYLEMNYSLPNVAAMLDSNPRHKQMKVFYVDFLKQGINTADGHSITIALSQNSAGSIAMSYSGNKTSFVNTSSITFNNKELGIIVDTTKYDDFLSEINKTLQADTTKTFDLFVICALNTIQVVLFYKKDSFDHHVLIKRTNLIQADGKKHMKVFTFDPNLENPSSYVHGHNKTFKVLQFIPNMLRLSQSLGYSFRI